MANTNTVDLGGLKKYKIPFYVLLGVILLTILFVRFRQVDSGTTAVLLQFGKIQDKNLGQGLQFAVGVGYEFVPYVTRTKKLELEGSVDGRDTEDIINAGYVTILTDKNLQVPIDINVLYRLKPSFAKEMYKTYGRDIIYDNKLVVPTASSTVRGVIGKVDIYELNTRREEFEKGILEEMNSNLNKYGVVVEQVRVKRIHLPEQITQAVLNKERAKEEAEQKKYEVEKAKQEANIEIEKQRGISKANEILNKSITNKLLEFKQIEVQLKQLDKWDGKMPEAVTILGRDANIPLNMLINNNRKSKK